jgi:ribose-phosphate pyrophosphokinase
MMQGALKLFAGSSHPQLAEAVAVHLGVPLEKMYKVRFANENIKIRLEGNVRGSDAFVIQTPSPPVHDHLVELLITIDALKYASADRITAVLPYFPYSRSDKKDEPRVSVTARLVADLLQTAGADRILTVNLHSMQVQAFARIPVDQLDAGPLISRYLAASTDLRGFIAVAPDIGRAKITETYARRLHLPVVILDKERTGDTENVSIRHVIGDVKKYKSAIFFDDEILTGGTVLAGVGALQERGVKRFLAVCVHGVLAGSAVHKVADSALERVVVTDTFPPHHAEVTSKIAVCSVAGLLGDAIRAIHESTSVATLFEDPS